LAKLILLVLGLLFAYWILKGYRKRIERDEQPPQMKGGEDMVRCAQCGVHLPRSEGISARGKFYCSPEHQRLHQPTD
jgi:uncharacterized protein